jgi:hypothetical protein
MLNNKTIIPSSAKVNSLKYGLGMDVIHEATAVPLFVGLAASRVG